MAASSPESTADVFQPTLKWLPCLVAAAVLLMLPLAARSAESSVLSYEPNFFADSRPSTALDMIGRLPGFTLDNGNPDNNNDVTRGFAGTAGNVLINGRRPTTKTDSLSDSIRVRVRHYDPTDTTSLSGRPVVFTLLYPADTTSFKLLPVGTVLTDVNGLAVVQVRLKQRTLPDSAVVQASVVRYFNHVAVPGSPMTFVVRFYP